MQKIRRRAPSEIWAVFRPLSPAWTSWGCHLLTNRRNNDLPRSLDNPFRVVFFEKALLFMRIRAMAGLMLSKITLLINKRNSSTREDLGSTVKVTRYWYHKRLDNVLPQSSSGILSDLVEQFSDLSSNSRDDTNWPDTYHVGKGTHCSGA